MRISTSAAMAVNTAGDAHEAVIVFPQQVGEAEGEEMQSDDLTLRNGLGFFGETDYQIVPKAIRIPAGGNRLEMKVKSHTVAALRVMKTQNA